MTALYSIAFKSLVIKEITRFMRIWIQTLVPPVITTTLYFVIFGNFIGDRIGYMGEFRLYAVYSSWAYYAGCDC